MSSSRGTSLRNLEAMLVRHGIVQSAAIEDAEGYDAGATRAGIRRVYEELLAQKAVACLNTAQAIAQAGREARVAMLRSLDPGAADKGQATE